MMLPERYRVRKEARDRLFSRSAPAPEGPEEISERARRLREGRGGALRGWALRKSGLERLSPATRLLLVCVLAGELALFGLGIFTELSALWLVAPALALLGLLAERARKKGEENDARQTAARDLLSGRSSVMERKRGNGV